MAPSRQGDDGELCLSGNRSPLMTANREMERPSWSRQGTMIQRPPARHYIPKYQFYYTTKELYETKHKTRQDMEADTKRFVAQTKNAAGDDFRRAFSAPGGRARRSQNSGCLPPLSGNDSRPSTRSSARRRLGPGNVNWQCTPVPGVRILPEYDLYRRDVLDERNPLYQIEYGLLPKYMGYVPGLKFRYGSTFGKLTLNAKEVGVERSATWGGSVSLF